MSVDDFIYVKVDEIIYLGCCVFMLVCIGGWGLRIVFRRGRCHRTYIHWLIGWWCMSAFLYVRLYNSILFCLYFVLVDFAGGVFD